jgi:hypothetical protein
MMPAEHHYCHEDDGEGGVYSPSIELDWTSSIHDIDVTIDDADATVESSSSSPSIANKIANGGRGGKCRRGGDGERSRANDDVAETIMDTRDDEGGSTRITSTTRRPPPSTASSSECDGNDVNARRDDEPGGKRLCAANLSCGFLDVDWTCTSVVHMTNGTREGDEGIAVGSSPAPSLIDEDYGGCNRDDGGEGKAHDVDGSRDDGALASTTTGGKGEGAMMASGSTTKADERTSSMSSSAAAASSGLNSAFDLRMRQMTCPPSLSYPVVVVPAKAGDGSSSSCSDATMTTTTMDGTMVDKSTSSTIPPNKGGREEGGIDGMKDAGDAPPSRRAVRRVRTKSKSNVSLLSRLGGLKWGRCDGDDGGGDGCGEGGFKSSDAHESSCQLNSTIDLKERRTTCPPSLAPFSAMDDVPSTSIAPGYDDDDDDVIVPDAYANDASTEQACGPCPSTLQSSSLRSSRSIKTDRPSDVDDVDVMMVISGDSSIPPHPARKDEDGGAREVEVTLASSMCGDDDDDGIEVQQQKPIVLLPFPSVQSNEIATRTSTLQSSSLLSSYSSKTDCPADVTVDEMEIDGAALSDEATILLTSRFASTDDRSAYPDERTIVAGRDGLSPRGSRGSRRLGPVLGLGRYHGSAKVRTNRRRASLLNRFGLKKKDGRPNSSLGNPTLDSTEQLTTCTDASNPMESTSDALPAPVEKTIEGDLSTLHAEDEEDVEVLASPIEVDGVEVPRTTTMTTMTTTMTLTTFDGTMVDSSNIVPNHDGKEEGGMDEMKDAGDGPLSRRAVRRARTNSHGLLSGRLGGLKWGRCDGGGDGGDGGDGSGEGGFKSSDAHNSLCHLNSTIDLKERRMTCPPSLAPFPAMDDVPSTSIAPNDDDNDDDVVLPDAYANDASTEQACGPCPSTLQSSSLRSSRSIEADRPSDVIDIDVMMEISRDLLIPPHPARKDEDEGAREVEVALASSMCGDDDNDGIEVQQRQPVLLPFPSVQSNEIATRTSTLQSSSLPSSYSIKTDCPADVTVDEMEINEAELSDEAAILLTSRFASTDDRSAYPDERTIVAGRDGLSPRGSCGSRRLGPVLGLGRYHGSAKVRTNRRRASLLVGLGLKKKDGRPNSSRGNPTLDSTEQLTTWTDERNPTESTSDALLAPVEETMEGDPSSLHVVDEEKFEVLASPTEDDGVEVQRHAIPPTQMSEAAALLPQSLDKVKVDAFAFDMSSVKPDWTSSINIDNMIDKASSDEPTNVSFCVDSTDGRSISIDEPIDTMEKMALSSCSPPTRIGLTRSLLKRVGLRKDKKSPASTNQQDTLDSPKNAVGSALEDSRPAEKELVVIKAYEVHIAPSKDIMTESEEKNGTLESMGGNASTESVHDAPIADDSLNSVHPDCPCIFVDEKVDKACDLSCVGSTESPSTNPDILPTTVNETRESDSSALLAEDKGVEVQILCEVDYPEEDMTSTYSATKQDNVKSPKDTFDALADASFKSPAETSDMAEEEMVDIDACLVAFDKSPAGIFQALESRDIDHNDSIFQHTAISPTKLNEIVALPLQSIDKVDDNFSSANPVFPYVYVDEKVEQALSDEAMNVPICVDSTDGQSICIDEPFVTKEDINHVDDVPLETASPRRGPLGIRPAFGLKRKGEKKLDTNIEDDGNKVLPSEKHGSLSKLQSMSNIAKKGAQAAQRKNGALADAIQRKGDKVVAKATSALNSRTSRMLQTITTSVQMGAFADVPFNKSDLLPAANEMRVYSSTCLEEGEGVEMPLRRNDDNVEVKGPLYRRRGRFLGKLQPKSTCKIQKKKAFVDAGKSRISATEMSPSLIEEEISYDDTYAQQDGTIKSMSRNVEKGALAANQSKEVPVHVMQGAVNKVNVAESAYIDAMNATTKETVATKAGSKMKSKLNRSSKNKNNQALTSHECFKIVITDHSSIDMMVRLPRNRLLTFKDLRREIEEDYVDDLPFYDFKFTIAANGIALSPMQEQKWRFHDNDLLNQGKCGDGTYLNPYLVYIECFEICDNETIPP